MKQKINCVICNLEIKYFAITGCCKTQCCANCILHVHYKGSNQCPFCKRQLTNVVITTLPTNDYDACLDYCFYQDKESTFYYDDVKLFKRCYNLTSLCCPECALEFKQNDLPVLHAFNDEEELKKHLHDKHNKYICSLCLEHTKLFPYQLSTYTIYGLENHLRSSDIDKIKNNQTKFFEHPICSVCKKQFYDLKGLYVHMRSDHIFCTLCSDGFTFFFKTKEELYRHCSKNHYLCSAMDCPLYHSYYGTYSEYETHIQQYHKDKQLSHYVDMPVEVVSQYVNSQQNEKKTSITKTTTTTTTTKAAPKKEAAPAKPDEDEWITPSKTFNQKNLDRSVKKKAKQIRSLVKSTRQSSTPSEQVNNKKKAKK